MENEFPKQNKTLKKKKNSRGDGLSSSIWTGIVVELERREQMVSIFFLKKAM